MMSWVYFIGIAIVGYVGIAIFNRMVGGDAASFIEAVKNTFTPVPFVVMVVSNVLLGGAVYYGFLSTQSAIPIMISIGVMVAFVYSVVFLGIEVTALKILGLLFIMLGIYLLQ